MTSSTKRGSHVIIVTSDLSIQHCNALELNEISAYDNYTIIIVIVVPYSFIF